MIKHTINFVNQTKFFGGNINTIVIGEHTLIAFNPQKCMPCI